MKLLIFMKWAAFGAFFPLVISFAAISKEYSSTGSTSTIPFFQVGAIIVICSMLAGVISVFIAMPITRSLKVPNADEKNIIEILHKYGYFVSENSKDIIVLSRGRYFSWFWGNVLVTKKIDVVEVEAAKYVFKKRIEPIFI